MRAGTVAAFAAAALLAACTSTTVEVATLAGKPVEDAEPPAAPEEKVAVPVEAFVPIDAFLDREGYLAGDILEIDCSLDPFKARFVALLAATGSTRWVAKEEGSDKAWDWVRLKNLAEGAAYQPNMLPTVTFGSNRREPAAAPDGTAPPPLFRFVATQEIRVRFHRESQRDRPVWFRARAVGTPSPLAPESVRDAIYAVAATGGRVLGPELGLVLSLDREGGAWVPRVVEPAAAGGAGPR